jgi:hypothetical protein
VDTRIEYGVVDENGELILLPGPDNYLRPTSSSLDWLKCLFGDSPNIVKVTVESIAQQGASTSQSVDTPQIQSDQKSDAP